MRQELVLGKGKHVCGILEMGNRLEFEEWESQCLWSREQGGGGGFVGSRVGFIPPVMVTEE